MALFTVGWGANQFVPMLLLYRREAALDDGLADSLFGAYALALIPALFLGGNLADRYGRRVVVPGVVASFAASAVLLSGTWLGTPSLLVGRILAGLASGIVFAPGAAWIKELSSVPWDRSRTSHAGARRAAVSMTGGFALGAVCTGALVQVGPLAMSLPYIPHLVLAIVALWALRHVPDTGRHPHREPQLPTTAATVSSKPATGLWKAMVPVAPWVFGAPAVVAVVLPTVLGPSLPGHEYVFSGLLIGGTMVIGVAIQPKAGRLEAHSPGSTGAIGLACVTVGLLFTVAAITWLSVPLSILAATAMGLGYSVCLVGGLTSVHINAPAQHLASTTAVFYAITYTGFGLPLLLTSLEQTGLGALSCLLVLASTTGVTAAQLERNRRRIRAAPSHGYGHAG